MLSSPFGIPCTGGGVTANGILNEPTSYAVGDQVIYTDYILHCRTADFGSLNTGDTITVGGTAYEVRELQKTADGLETQISLSKT